MLVQKSLPQTQLRLIRSFVFWFAFVLASWATMSCKADVLKDQAEAYFSLPLTWYEWYEFHRCTNFHEIASIMFASVEVSILVRRHHTSSHVVGVAADHRLQAVGLHCNTKYWWCDCFIENEWSIILAQNSTAGAYLKGLVREKVSPYVRRYMYMYIHTHTYTYGLARTTLH